MGFQRARTEKQIAERKNEIIYACKKIYINEGYEGVNLKKISEMTSFTRPAIYNYYKTKEEIFLDILKEEFSLWKKDLLYRYSEISEHTREEFCTVLSDSLCERTILLELLAVHLNIIENNSRLEQLVEFKKTVYKFFDVLKETIELFFPNKNANLKEEFFNVFLIYINGLYPHMFHSKIQQKAMALAGKPAIQKDLKEICRRDLLLITSNLK